MVPWANVRRLGWVERAIWIVSLEARRGKERVHEPFLWLLSGGSVEEWNLRKEPSTGAHDPQIFAGTYHSSTPDFICCMQAKRLWETCACARKRGDEAHTHIHTQRALSAFGTISRHSACRADLCAPFSL